MGAVLVVGATSGIGAAAARRFAEDGHDLVLAGRDAEALAANARDLEIRHGVEARAVAFDALDYDAHGAWLKECAAPFPDGFEGVLLCMGEMPEAESLARDPRLFLQMVEVNYVSAVSLLDRVAELFVARGSGWICAVSSVAGDRGRPKNHHYGSTKAALSTYLGGLRARLSKQGVSVVDVRPGMVDTRMTWGLPGLVFVGAPDRVAADIAAGIRRDRAIVYTPRIWALVMLVIRCIPDFVFKRPDL